jgi:hypothetical protein
VVVHPARARSGPAGPAPPPAAPPPEAGAALGSPRQPCRVARTTPRTPSRPMPSPGRPGPKNPPRPARPPLLRMSWREDAACLSFQARAVTERPTIDSMRRRIRGRTRPRISSSLPARAQDRLTRAEVSGRPSSAPRACRPHSQDGAACPGSPPSARSALARRRSRVPARRTPCRRRRTGARRAGR